MLTTPTNGLSMVKPGSSPTDKNRRSIYLLARRVYPLRFLELFDSPVVPVNCTKRPQSATVLQSLALLNSQFVVEGAESMAGRVQRHAGDDPSQQVRVAYRLSLCRDPDAGELKSCRDFLTEQAADSDGPAALRDLCQNAVVYERVPVCSLRGLGRRMSVEARRKETLTMFDAKTTSIVATPGPTRRQMLAEAGSGFGTLALAGMLEQDGLLAAGAEPSDLVPRAGHARPRARAVIQLFQNGGPSQMDLFDEKPELTAQHGKVPSQEIETFQLDNNNVLLKSPYRFLRGGRVRHAAR